MQVTDSNKILTLLVEETKANSKRLNSLEKHLEGLTIKINLQHDSITEKISYISNAQGHIEESIGFSRFMTRNWWKIPILVVILYPLFKLYH